MTFDVYASIADIPRGRVATYGAIAHLAGLRSPRHVGYLLHHNPDPARYPCHRVVNATGCVAASYAFGGASAQREKLEKEGVTFTNDRVDLARYGWAPAIGP